MSTPYENATSGVAARDEITKLLRRFGCGSIGFMDDYDKHEVLLVFEHRGRKMQLRASAKGWATLFLKEHPYNYRHKGGEQQHRDKALPFVLIWAFAETLCRELRSAFRFAWLEVRSNIASYRDLMQRKDY